MLFSHRKSLGLVSSTEKTGPSARNPFASITEETLGPLGLRSMAPMEWDEAATAASILRASVAPDRGQFLLLPQAGHASKVPLHARIGNLPTHVSARRGWQACEVNQASNKLHLNRSLLLFAAGTGTGRVIGHQVLAFFDSPCFFVEI